MNPENSDASDDEGYDSNFYHEPAREDPKKPKRFQYTSASVLDKTNIVRSSDFEAFPPVLHFTGFVVGQEYSLVLNIINCSSYKKRMNILPLNSKSFKLDYTLSGSLAAGLSQKIVVIFKPSEYKYFYDCIRIQGKDDDLLIPLHAYPISNVVEFPRTVGFGSVPLCEPASKTLTLKCSIPVDFYYEFDILRPHPYFKISPVKGLIPANGDVKINVTFNPITLGTCLCTIRLNIAQHDFQPVDCVISAKAVSGLIESRELQIAEEKVDMYVSNIEMKTTQSLGATTFPKNLKETLKISQPPATDKAAMKAVAVVLNSTFQTDHLGSALKSVLRSSTLDEKTQDAARKAGLLKPRGPGGGAVFDPGAQWLTSSISEKRIQRESKGITGPLASTILPPPEQDRLIEGVRIPPNLDNMPGVNFVITQERGKLKPKDLRAAIERNVADRERRAAEQQKMREEGGGAGTLDINGILAEERLNSSGSDPFKRQLREMAFLADVDEVQKLELEKGFRVSGEYLGANLLSAMDIEVILKQRQQNAAHKAREDWRTDQSRLSTALYTPMHLHVKAGADAIISAQLLDCLRPSFDPNKNDIWSKRLNTLRKFVGLVSRWILRKRLLGRFGKVTKTFRDAGAETREQVLAYIAAENESNKSNVSLLDNSKQAKEGTYSSSSADAEQKPTTLATLVCSLPNKALQSKLKTTLVNNTKKFEVNPDMVRRVLFPKFTANEASTRAEVETVDISGDTNFDDKAYFPLKVRPEYVFMGYEPFVVPPGPVYLPSNNDKAYRLGAQEESVIRPAAHVGIRAVDLLSTIPPESSKLSEPSKALVDAKVLKEGESYLQHLEDDLNFSTPDWLSGTSEWSQKDLDLLRTQPNMRVYAPLLRQKEADDSWVFRPFAPESREKLKYTDDSSLRTSLLNEGGFLSANMYILGGVESRSVDPIPNTGPFLSQTFLQDVDRHASGLSCYSRDHQRGLLEQDPDIGPLQRTFDPADELTDSDSDNEEVYVPMKPSLAAVKRIISAPPPQPAIVAAPAVDSKAKGGKGAIAPAPVIANPAPNTVDTLNSEAFSVLDENDKKRDQVELMRDRKILELGSSIRKEREARFAAITSRLEQISSASICAVNALPVQKPFHQFEEEVYELMERTIPNILTSFVERSNTMDGTLSPSKSVGFDKTPISPL